MNNTETNQNVKKYKIIFSVLLLVLAMASVGAILLMGKRSSQTIADIYQNGKLLESINLSDLTEARTFTVTGENGCTNVVEARPGSIGILSASCPDKLCVHQGFIQDSLLPITCLPNRLVIQLRSEGQNPFSGHTGASDAPDIITY